MNQVVVTLVVGLIGLFAAGVAWADEKADQARPVRIGVYDSRAIATAWAASRFNPVAERMKEFETARKAKDEKKIAELEAWGQEHQRKLHMQGFGRVPVSDLLEPVQDQVRDLMARNQLAAITMHCDALAEGVATVDITSELVQLYDPSPQTLTWVKQLAGKQPLSLIELARLSDHP